MVHYKGQSFLKPRQIKNYKKLIVDWRPVVNVTPASNRYIEFCKLELIKHEPWSGEMSNAWKETKPCTASEKDAIIAAYNSFMQDEEFLQKLHVPKMVTKIAEISTIEHNRIRK